MEYFNLFLKVMLGEKMKFNLYEPDIIQSISEMSSFDAFYERPYERCAYMYKYAACHLNFMKDCFQIFLNNYPRIKELLLKWKTCKNMQICSLSHGPALDYLALTIALTENVEVELQKSFDVVKVISKSTQWKHTYSIMVEAIQMGYLNNFPVSMICDNFKFLQNKNQKFNEKQRAALQDVNILCMMKTINSQSEDIPEEMKNYFKAILSSMKEDSLLFCIDTKPSIVALSKILFEIPGEYIFEPVCNTVRFPEKFPDFYKEQFGGLPIIITKGWFFVWKKLSPNPIYKSIYPSIFIEKSPSETEQKTSVSLTDRLNLINNPSSTYDCSSMNEIEKSFNESLKITDNYNLTDSMSILHISKKESSLEVPLFVCDIKGNISIHNQIHPTLTGKRDAEILPLNESECAINQDNFLSPNLTLNGSNSKTSNLEHNLNLDSCTTRSPSLKNLSHVSSSTISSSSNISQSRKNDSNKPLSTSTPNQTKNNKNLDLVKKTPDENKNEEFGKYISPSQFDNSKNKTNEKQTNKSMIDISSKKKSVKIGTDLTFKGEGKSSIEDLTNRIQKLVSSFEDVISRNNQCKILKENVTGDDFKHQACGKSSLSCKSNFSPNFNNTATSSNDVAELPSYQSPECNAPSYQTVIEPCDQGTAQANIHNSQCSRLQSCCKCRTQNCSSRALESNLCCMKHNCYCETMKLNGICDQGFQNGINLTGPNIIIPLQNINDDTLAQLLTVLKTETTSKH